MKIRFVRSTVRTGLPLNPAIVQDVKKHQDIFVLKDILKFSFLRCEKTSREVGVNLKDGYNGDLTSREAGSVGGQMVKKMIESYEKSL